MTSEQQKLSEIRGKDLQELDSEVRDLAEQFYSNSPKNWGFGKLEDLVDNFIDYRGKTPSKAEEGIHMLSAANLKDGFILPKRKEKFVSEETFAEWTTRGIPEVGDVIISTEAPVGEVGVIRTNEKFLTAQRLITMRPGEKLDSRYLKFCMQYERTQKQLESYASGTTVSSFNQTDLRNTVIPLPPLREQEKIGQILDNLERKVNLNKDIDEELEQIGRSLFQSYFVDFAPYSEFKETKLGKIPESFEVGTLGELMEKKTEGVDPEKMSSSTSYISLKHMPEESLILDNWGHAGDISSRKYQFKKDDLLFGKLRPYFCKVGPAPVDGVCSTDIVVINPRRDEYWKEFLTFQLSSSSFIDYCDKVSTGTRMPRVGWKDMCEYEIAIPPEEAIKQFYEQIGPILDMIVSNVHESENLRRVRDALLPKLMSGEVRANDISLDDLEVDIEV